MIAKAKAISHGINDLRYITGESQHKKHPEKIYRVLDNLLPSEPDAMGIWNSMQLTLSQHRPIKNSVIRIELSPSPKHRRLAKTLARFRRGVRQTSDYRQERKSPFLSDQFGG